MKNSKKKSYIGWMLATVMFAYLLTSCAARAPRKCDGRRAIYTPMGPM